MLKNDTILIERVTSERWKLTKRTRGTDGPMKPDGRVTQNWVYILTNKDGHRRFLPEPLLAKEFILPDEVVETTPESS